MGWTYSEFPWVSDLPDSRRAGHGPCHCLDLNRGREEQFREDNEVDHDAQTDKHTRTVCKDVLKKKKEALMLSS